MDWKVRIAYLATLHRKEEVTAPLLAEHLGIQVQVIPLDTDQFGTFSRERPRPGDPLHTLRLKIERARQAYPAPLVLASEGSFGPHPQIPWMPWNQEWVMLKVFESGADPLELVGYAESTPTNFSHRWVQSFAEALDFAQKVGFPEHALIALDQPENPQVIHKGIQDEATLRQVVEELLARQQGLHLETDMRALYNPTRLQVIAAATQNLIAKAQSLCPACGTPG
ncbi:hypothetical protein NW806_09385 [Synechococcus sp. W65.1]|uniref:DUF6671 family protein n=1 Tax=Synechococcus sp. W65.1 TaxID=2964526 RepID=UPI0039C31493